MRLGTGEHPVGVTTAVATPGIERFDPCASTAVRTLLGVADGAACRMPQAMGMSAAAGRRATLHVRGTPLLDLVVDPSGRRITLVPRGAFHRLRGDGDVPPRWEALLPDDVVTLTLVAPTGTTTRVPLARWHMEPLERRGD
ncbi:MAG: hypothetical protein KIT14_10495 [bacterium]|nr:hypothetical protein [bacterium]